MNCSCQIFHKQERIKFCKQDGKEFFAMRFYFQKQTGYSDWVVCSVKHLNACFHSDLGKFLSVTASMLWKRESTLPWSLGLSTVLRAKKWKEIYFLRNHLKGFTYRLLSSLVEKQTALSAETLLWSPFVVGDVQWTAHFLHANNILEPA